MTQGLIKLYTMKLIRSQSYEPQALEQWIRPLSSIVISRVPPPCDSQLVSAGTSHDSKSDRATWSDFNTSRGVDDSCLRPNRLNPDRIRCFITSIGQ